MSFRKNVVSFLLAAFLALLFILYAVFTVENNAGLFRGLFSYDGNGTFTVFRQHFSVGEETVDAVGRYFAACERMSTVFFPEALRKPLQKNAEKICGAACLAASGLQNAVQSLIRGNM